jgi:hypothetical protein
MERLIVTAIAVLALLLTQGATSVSAAPPSGCRVRIVATGQTYGTLQAAVDAAKRGDRLTVSGHCLGPTIIDKGLVIEGVEGRGRPLLDGDREGVTLTIREGVTVKVTDLDIEGGRFQKDGSDRPYHWPAGVENHGNLTLRGIVVRRNEGIGVENEGRLRLNGDSVVGHNWTVLGNAVYRPRLPGIHNAGSLRLNGTSAVEKNNGVANDGTVILHGASSVNVTRNRGSMTLHDAGHVAYVENRGALTLDDESGMGTVYNFGTVTMNDASGVWGPVTNDSRSSMTLNGSSSIGIGRVRNNGTLTLNGSASIFGGRWVSCGVPSGLCPGDPRIFGGGVTNGGRLVLNDSSSISGNLVERQGLPTFGGGVYMNSSASLTMTGSATITGNAAGQGGGVYAESGSLLNGVVCGPGGNVYGNTPDDCYVEP